jgi:hypothetical protein
MNQTVASILREKKIRFYHAVQFKDFEAYCKAGAILSRKELSEITDDYTRFWSDEIDKKKGVWDRVFGNLQNFGEIFWDADGTTPNLYGPITLECEHTVWDDAHEVVITRKSVVSPEIDYARDRLSEQEVASCFELKNSNWHLKREMYKAEVSIAAKVMYSHLTSATVEPISDSFLDEVRRTALGLSGGIVNERKDDLMANVPASLQQWAKTIKAGSWHPLKSWLKYMYNGTLKWLDPEGV